VFLPMIIIYTSWVYRVMRGRVTLEDVEHSHNTY
jgi:cytochrome d ubiquinol oxidase subunit II